jgi:hypothetical protein
MDRYDKLICDEEIDANLMIKIHWTEKHSSAKKIRWEFELKRINYTLGQKRRESLMNELDKHNKDIQNLLGNSERLEPMRRKRKSTIPKFFQQIRNQAHNLHSALGTAWKCECKISHATKLLLEKRVGKDKMGVIEMQGSASVKFGVFFSSEIGLNPEWHATEIMLAEPRADIERKLSQGTEFGRGPLITDTGSKFDSDTMSQGVSTISSLGTASTKHSRSFDSGSRSISFLGSSMESFSSWASSSGFETLDLCSTLKQRSKAPQFLGLLKDGTNQYFAVDVVTEPKVLSEDAACVITLESLLTTNATGKKNAETDIALPRRVRLAIAVTLANSLLQLYSGPWLPETWSSKDIYFFQKSNGVIHTDHPLVHYQFQSRSNRDDSKDIIYPINARKQRSHSGNSSLLSLGIVILELWFNRTLESLSFRKDFFGPDGKENEYTNFNTAQKWQEMTMEEAGPDLYNPTRRCVYCAFGAASQDLEDDELKRAVYDEVVQPLERLLGRFEDVLVE